MNLNPFTPLVRRLLVYLRRYVLPYVLLLLGAELLLSATNGAIPLLVRDFINQLYKFHDLSAIKVISFEVLALFLARALASFGSDYLDAYIGQKVTVDLRADLNERLQNQSLAFFNATPTGTMISRVINDVQVIVSGTLSGAFSLIGDGGSLLAVLAAALYIDWRLALAAFVVFPAAVLPIVGFSKRMRQMTRDAQRQLGGLTVLLQETYQGNRVVKAFGMEDYERARFNRELRRLFRIYLRVARIRAVTGPMIEVLGAFAFVAIIWWGTASVLAGHRTFGTFGAFIAAMLVIYRPFKNISRTNNGIQAGLAAAERVFEMIDAPVAVPDVPNGQELHPGRHRVEFDCVSFRYGDEWVLRDVTLTIGAGEVVALVGMSGGGKSTMADLIPRFYDVAAGAVKVDGVDVREYKLSSLRAQIGLVTQHTFLFNDTVRANIAYGSVEKSDAAIVAAATAAHAHDFITRLPHGYDTVIGEMGVRLSGGERQRLAIARAVLKDAPILILDEATSSLDSEAERQVQDALERLMENRTTLVIAHRLATVRRADRIAVVVHGRILEEGTHDQLLVLGHEYRKLHELQFMSTETGGNGGSAG